MSSYPMVSHEWLIDVMTFLFHSKFGYEMLAFIYTFLVFLVVLILFKIFSQIKKSDSKKLPSAIIILLFCSVIISFTGVRPQVVGWVFFVYLIKVLFYSEKKAVWKLPFIFFIWGNMHGSFSAGLLAFAITIFARILSARKLDSLLISIFLLSALSTLINPYGIGTWKEVWTSVTDNSLRWRIGEWMPGIFSFNPGIIMITTLTATLIFRYKRRFAPDKLSIFIIFLLLGVSSARHLPLLILVASTLLYQGLAYFSEEFKAKKEILRRFNVVLKWAVILSLIIFVYSWYEAFKIVQKVSLYSFYPKSAVEYLSHNLTEGNMFSMYGWGGYLMWKLPEKKVFIDGRMPSWRWNTNLENESNYAMQEYIAIFTGGISFEEVSEKYDIDIALLSLQKPNESWLSNRIKQLVKKQDVRFSLIEELNRLKWRKTYEDEVAVIYQKN